MQAAGYMHAFSVKYNIKRRSDNENAYYTKQIEVHLRDPKLLQCNEEMSLCVSERKLTQRYALPLLCLLSSAALRKIFGPGIPKSTDVQFFIVQSCNFRHPISACYCICANCELTVKKPINVLVITNSYVYFA